MKNTKNKIITSFVSGSLIINSVPVQALEIDIENKSTKEELKDETSKENVNSDYIEIDKENESIDTSEEHSTVDESVEKNEGYVVDEEMKENKEQLDVEEDGNVNKEQLDVEEDGNVNKEQLDVEEDGESGLKQEYIGEDLIQETKEDTEVGNKVVKGSVLNITLSAGQSLEDLTGNPDGYETIIVTTTGSKKLSSTDLSMLNKSTIPNIDLSNAQAISIPNNTFKGNKSLTTFKFPKGITSIGVYSFQGCTNLTGDLIIPNTVKSIGSFAFQGCTGLNGTLTLPSSLITISGNAFLDCRGLTGDLYIPQGVTTIGGNAFKGCSGFNGKLTLSNSLESIGGYAFQNCSGLVGELVIPDMVTSIGSYAFQNCTGFTEKLIIGNSVKTISDNAFRGCSKLTGDLIIPDSTTSIGTGAFMSCSGFNGKLKISNSVTSIGNNAFQNCTGLIGDLIIPDSVVTIGSNSFNKCSGFTGNLVIPNSVKTIGAYAFSECTGINGDLMLGKSVESIESNSFTNCNNIKRVLISVDDSHVDTNYRESVIKKLAKDKTYIEISYNTDISGTWLETSDYTKVQPKISTYSGTFENNEGIGISLEVEEASPIKTMSILKDSLDYNLEKSENGKYVFDEAGDYEIYIETELGTTSNISFKNNNPVLTPSLEFNGNIINIIKNGVHSNGFVEKVETLEYRVDGGEWQVYNGTFGLNYPVGTKVQIEVRATHDGYVSDIVKKEAIVELNQKHAEDAEGAVEKVEQSKKPSDIEDARGLVDNLPQCTVKEELTNRLNTLEELIAKENAATQVVEKAEQSKDSTDISDARDLVDILPQGTVKEELTNRLDALEELISKENAAIQAVEKAEQSKDSTDISDARDLVDILPDGTIKEELTNRVGKLEKENEAKQAVTKVEQSKDSTDISDARDLVDKLPDGEVKENLTNRLDALEELIAKENMAKQAVAKAEKSKDSTDISDARNLIDKLPDGEVKENLNDKLDKLEELISKENSAIQAVTKAENTKNSKDINNARGLVGQLPQDTLKENLTNRLDKLEELISKENEAIQAVIKVENTKNPTDISKIRALLRKLPDGPIKEELTNRLDALEELMVKEDKAEQAVEKAEQSKDSTDIDAARDLISKLPDGDKKQELIGRLYKLEEGVIQSDNNDSPKTGDNLMMHIGGLIASIIGIVELNRRKKK